MGKNTITLMLWAALLVTMTCAAQAPAVTTTNSPDVAEFQRVEEAWSAAVNGRDQYGLELVLSPLLVDVAASGEITTRNQQIAQLVSGADKTLHYEQQVVTVRRLGDVAVVNGTYRMHHKTDSGAVDERGVFTHVFERQRGHWQCLNAQRTAVREVAPVKGKKGSRD